MKQIPFLLIASASLCFADPLFVEPQFLQDRDSSVTDYRPVVNAEGTKVIFERSPSTDPNDTKLYIGDLSAGYPPHAQNVHPFVNFPSTRPDWCWNTSGGTLTSGPVAFTGDDGLYRVDPEATPTPIPNTGGMIYPAWYPGCHAVAADVGATAALGTCQESVRPLTAKIDAFTGNVLICRLAKDNVWAGFPSVNQANPNLVSFAGQFNREDNYYNQELNYTWVTDTSTGQPRTFPMDRHAPRGPSFQQKFQARAGSWSLDGKWFAFESNRICNDVTGKTYAIFIQDPKGIRPAMQVSDCTRWNVQHPKWFPPREDGRVLLIAAVQPASGGPFRIASFDVTAFVSGQ